MKKTILLVIFALIVGVQAFAQSVAVFNFAANPWHIETASTGDEPEVGKIEDSQSITQNGIILSCQKVNSRYWNRILDDKFRCYVNNSIAFTAPQNVVITKIVFKNVAYQCDMEEVTQTGGTYQCEDSDEDMPYAWTGRTAFVKFKATGTSVFKTIEVTYEPESATAIKGTNIDKTANGDVYTLQGVRVGSANMLPSLPSGVYIVNGKKVIK